MNMRKGMMTALLVLIAAPVALAQEEEPTEEVFSEEIPQPSQEESAALEQPQAQTLTMTTSIETPPPELTEDEPLVEDEEDESVFSWFSLAPEVGYVFYPKSKMTVQGFSATVEPRNGFLAKLHLDLGGDGLAFEFAPLFAVEAGGINSSGGNFGDTSIDLSQGLMSGSFQAIGGQMSLVYRFKIGRYFYPNLGISFHGTYLMGKEIDFGTELYGRIPLGFTVYMGPHVGFVFEVGLMYGVTGIKTPLVLPDIVVDSMEPSVIADLQNCGNPDDVKNWYNDNQAYLTQWLEDNQSNLPANYNQDQLVQDFVGDQLGQSIRYGAGFGIDITIGIRFP